ncbi:hypothetical protein PAL_GLEAN10011609 [Pteropus alecto]|uniref:Uncharacterized protein n=1 Tax=Pteropus alecto TaxID=9402 RepID=L5KGK2_PTEAL|nr:hypothetical protein PAL_GLEAN10011609 [Pteropus alecto]
MDQLGFSAHTGLPHYPLLVKLQVTPQTGPGLPSSGTPDHSSDEPPPRQELNWVKPFWLAWDLAFGMWPTKGASGILSSSACS